MAVCSIDLVMGVLSALGDRVIVFTFSSWILLSFSSISS